MKNQFGLKMLFFFHVLIKRKQERTKEDCKALHLLIDVAHSYDCWSWNINECVPTCINFNLSCELNVHCKIDG